MDYDDFQIEHKPLLTNLDRSVDLDISTLAINLNGVADPVNNDVNNSFNQNIEINNDIALFQGSGKERRNIHGYEEEVWERFLLNTGKQFSYRQSSLDKEYRKVHEFQEKNQECLKNYLEIQQSLQEIEQQLSIM